jgi:hypothetical protein
LRPAPVESRNMRRCSPTLFPPKLDSASPAARVTSQDILGVWSSLRSRRTTNPPVQSSDAWSRPLPAASTTSSDATRSARDAKPGVSSISGCFPGLSLPLLQFCYPLRASPIPSSPGHNPGRLLARRKTASSGAELTKCKDHAGGMSNFRALCRSLFLCGRPSPSAASLGTGRAGPCSSTRVNTHHS